MPIINGVAHYPECRCLLCAKFSKVCECCDKEFKSWPAYRRHQTAKPKLKRGSKKPPRAAVVPDGLGFLERVLASQQQLQKYNLSVISRFCAALNDMRPGSYRARFTKAHKRLLLETESNTLLPFRLELPAQQARAALRLAQSVNTSPGDTLALLVQYGLEHLAQELRTNSVAPPVQDPQVKTTLIQERQTASQEFLGEEPKTREYTEFSSPANPRRLPDNRSSLIPRST